MNKWRMAFREGNQGHSLWPTCLRLGVAAITYDALSHTDFSKFPPNEPRELWSQLAPTQIGSLRRLAYDMRPGDTIYVKEGVRIVGKGTLESGYYFDETNGMVDENEIPWPHQVKVFWQRDFSPVEIVLGADQHTVLKLSDDDAALIERQAETVSAEADRLTALEGESFSAESDFRSRNRALVAAKKHLFDFHCEICGFSFEEKYGEIGEDFIIAHHLRPISSGPTVTTLDDIALVCSNCHSMVHMRNPPYLVQEMKTILNGLQQ